MNKPIPAPFFWDRSGPLSRLSGAVLLVGATSRLSHALVVFSSLLVVYVTTVVLLRLAASAVPRQYKGWIRVLVASTVSALFSRIAGMAWPLLVAELALYLGMVPLCLVSSGLLDRTEGLRRYKVLKLTAYESLTLFGLALALALFREPIGFGVLSLPALDGISVLFSNEKAAAYSLRAASATAGGLMLIGYLLAIYRKIGFRIFGNSPTEERDA